MFELGPISLQRRTSRQLGRQQDFTATRRSISDEPSSRRPVTSPLTRAEPRNSPPHLGTSRRSPGPLHCTPACPPADASRRVAATAHSLHSRRARRATHSRPECLFKAVASLCPLFPLPRARVHRNYRRTAEHLCRHPFQAIGAPHRAASSLNPATTSPHSPEPI